MSVEEAIKMVISGGIITPQDRRTDEEKASVYTSAATYERIDFVREKDGSRVLVAKGTRPNELQGSVVAMADENETIDN